MQATGAAPAEKKHQHGEPSSDHYPATHAATISWLANWLLNGLGVKEFTSERRTLIGASSDYRRRLPRALTHGDQPLSDISVLAPTDVSILREEIIRHGDRSARFVYRLAVLSGVFVLLTETHTSVKFGGVPVHNISLVLTVVPPVVGFMLIQAVDSLFIRQRYISILECLVRQTMPRVTAADLGYVFVPYNLPSADMLSSHRRAARCLYGLEAFTNLAALFVVCGFLIFSIYSLHHRFGVSNALADVSMLVTAVSAVRAASAIVGIGLEE
jgi:hypothetical protein